MLSRRLSRIVLLLSMTTFLAAPLAPLAEAAEHDLAHMPAWETGDNWNWKKDPTSARGSRSTGNLTWMVDGRENLTLDLWEPGDLPAWHTQDVWRVQSWLNTTIPTEETAIEIRQENVMYRRAADHALARSEVDDFYSIGLPNGSAEEAHTERNLERFAPLLELQFPFGVGDAWRVRTEQRHVTINSDDCGGAGQPSCRGGGPKAFTYSVAGTEKLTLTINGEETTLDTWRIKVTDETTGTSRNDQMYEIWWYAEETCNVVLREQFSGDRQKIGIFTLTDYHCSGETLADPDYELWDFDEFSSTRFHGELSQDALKGVRTVREDPGFAWTPGPGAPLVAFAMILVAAIVAGRARRL